MHNEKSLIGLLQGLTSLLADEAARNENFARRLDELLAVLPPAKAPKPAPKSSALPDIHAELAARGDADFLAWLNSLPVPVLRAIIKREDLDSARKSARWKADKLAELIANGLAARRSRGSGFLTEAAKE